MMAAGLNRDVCVIVWEEHRKQKKLNSASVRVYDDPRQG